jgi:cytochrome c oxidase subunit 2
MSAERSEAATPGGHTSRIEAAAVVALILLLAVFVVAYGMQGWMPGLASRHGAGIDRMLVYLLVTTGSLVVAGHIVMGWLIWKFTAQRKVSFRMASPRAERNLSIALALLMTLVAEGGVLAIGMPAWSEYFATQPPSDAVTVEVVGEQFAWNVRYPGRDGRFGPTSTSLIDATNSIGLDRSHADGADDIVMVNEIHLPVGRPARFVLKSKDVIHSFFLPHLRVKQDLVPGMVVPIWFVPTREGEYELACAELCGLAHYRMRGVLTVESPGAFAAWLEANAPAPAGGSTGSD